MSTYQNTDVVRNDDDDFETNTGEGMIASLLVSSKKKKQTRRKSSALTMLVATAFCGVSGVGLVSWNNSSNNTNNNEPLLARSIGDVVDADVDLVSDADLNLYDFYKAAAAAAAATKKPVDACDDAIHYDDDGCFLLSHCDDTFHNNYVMCYGARKNFNIIDFDLYEHGPQRVCPKQDSLTKYLFGEDYVVDHCYDTHCYPNRNAEDDTDDDTDLLCVYTDHDNGEKKHLVALECGTLFTDGTCRVCKVDI